MDDQLFEQPVLNSPYHYPSRHWELDDQGQPTGKIKKSRRPAQFITPIPKAEINQGAWVSLKVHIDNIVTFARHRIANALAEGMNAKIEKIKRMAYGYRNRSHYRAAIYFHRGGLDLFPRPPVKPSLSFISLCAQHVGGSH